MDRQDIKKDLENIIDKASTIEATLNSTGWQLWEEMLQEEMSVLRDIKNVSSLKDLEANKKAIKIIENALNKYKDLVSSGAKAVTNSKYLGETTP
jgi:hypothetical protein